MGSVSDREVMEESVRTLKEFEIPSEMTVSSAHRSPETTRDYALTAADRGIEIIIAGAGWAAHLAGVVASHTNLPVIGVPIDSSPLRGMPPGIPVATMAIGRGGARNAAVFAAQILSLKYADIAERLKRYREGLALKIKGVEQG